MFKREKKKKNNKGVNRLHQISEGYKHLWEKATAMCLGNADWKNRPGGGESRVNRTWQALARRLDSEQGDHLITFTATWKTGKGHRSRQQREGRYQQMS